VPCVPTAAPNVSLAGVMAVPQSSSSLPPTLRCRCRRVHFEQFASNSSRPCSRTPAWAPARRDAIGAGSRAPAWRQRLQDAIRPALARAQAAKGGMRCVQAVRITPVESAVVGREPYRVELNL